MVNSRDEIEDLKIPLFLKLAGGMGMVAGLFTLGLAAQTALVFHLRGVVLGALAGMLLLGFAAVVAGWGTVQGRGPAAIAGAVAGGLIASLGTIWAITGLSAGVISPLSFGVIFLAVVASILLGVAVGPARKVSAARAALRAQGYDFGV